MNKIKICIYIFVIVSLILILWPQRGLPTRVKQKMILGIIKNCIWYGCDESTIYNGSKDQKKDILLPETLEEYKSLVTEFGLNESINANKSDLLFNPRGIENKTWIAVFKAKGIKGLYMGDLVLWYDKRIENKKGFYKKVSEKPGCKSYIINFD